MKLIISILTILLLLPTLALADDVQNAFLEDAVSEIMLSQGVDAKEKVDCEKVTEARFEELGEAVMSTVHPDPKQHELMDNMMGGEGSESLSSMHKMMGQRYLGCSSNTTGSGMMGSGMMGGMMMGGSLNSMTKGGENNMMLGNFGVWSWFGWIFMVLFWLIIIVGIIALARWLVSRGTGEGKERPALDILKERYAKGEIDRKEFEAKKKDLK